MESKEHPLIHEVLSSVGDNGRYQKILFWFFLVPISIIIPWTALVPIFQSSVPDHWCHVPGRPDDTSLEDWKRLTIPREAGNPNYFSKCEQFTSVLSPKDRNTTSDHEKIACKEGWDFDTTWYDRTLPMDQNWVCDRDIFKARWLAAGVAGNVVGTLLFNTLCDYWGRKMTTVLATQAYAVFATCRLFMKSDLALLTLMFFSSMPFPALLQISYIWVLEQVSKDLRAQITSVSCVMWTAGMCLLPLLAWLSRNWILLGVITSFPFVPFIIIWCVLPESPRWLISRGRIEDGVYAFTKIAFINGKKVPGNLPKTLKAILCNPDDEEKQLCTSYVSILDFIKYPFLRKLLFILVTVYTSNYLMYYIIIHSMANISGNEFLNFFLVAITEFPGNLLGWLCSEVFGRRFTGVAFFFMSAIVAAVAIVLSSHQTWTIIFAMVLCKGLVNVCFFTIYIQMAEIYPTSHRGTGIGICSITALLFGICVPYIAYSGTQWLPLPYVLLLLIGTIGAVAAAFIPETLDAYLPHAITDVGNLWKKHSFWSYKGWKPMKYKSVSLRM